MRGEAALHGEAMISNHSNSAYHFPFDCLLTRGTPGLACHFRGEKVPLERFLAPFLFENQSLSLTGSADFEGSFNDHHLKIACQVPSISLEGSKFKLGALGTPQGGTYEINVLTGEYLGVLPLIQGTYWQKNYGFELDHATAMAIFENGKISIKELSAESAGLQLQGKVEIVTASCDHVDLMIAADSLSGTISAGQQFLSHFNHSPICFLPLDGHIYCHDMPLLFHYRLTPEATLIEGRVHGDLYCTSLPSYFEIPHCYASFNYDCKTGGLYCHANDGNNPLFELSYTSENGSQGVGKKIAAQGA